MARKGATGALLDIYQYAIEDLQQLIYDIPDADITIVIDEETEDDNFRSVQTILSHVVHQGFTYATSIYDITGNMINRPPKILHNTIDEYLQDLNKVFSFTEKILKETDDAHLEQLDNSKKIKTGWGQIYDIEQLMEHAIVHVLRHKRQLERIKNLYLQ
ncbi:MAG: DinB family protein [Ferruginibacter sp.]